ncbi:hypothetical protein BJ875DRAFT_215437 [Amylocarpus encephaloides]|uniref:Uncharacterized protein n=1 Tax=Amylocarpus encephaloides TaxID=45428 RepID=A0A9P8C7B6_9HELO|nr:hypothetical protein BJ875DRAFT_215437 [Amylocarpus encephaloides]
MANATSIAGMGASETRYCFSAFFHAPSLRSRVPCPYFVLRTTQSFPSSSSPYLQLSRPVPIQERSSPVLTISSTTPPYYFVRTIQTSLSFSPPTPRPFNSPTTTITATTATTATTITTPSPLPSPSPSPSRDISTPGRLPPIRSLLRAGESRLLSPES